MLVLHEFCRAIGANKQESCAFPSSCEIGNKIQGGIIAPMQVFEHQHQRFLSAERFQCFSNFPQHTSPGSLLSLLLKRRQISSADERRHLYEPSRSIATQHINNVLAPGGTAQPPERVQHGKIGFTRAILLQALPAPDPEMPGGS